MMETQLHPPDKKVGASSSVATWCTMAGSLSTETKQNTQEVEDDGQENDARDTQATIPSETRPSSLLYTTMLYTTMGSLHTSLHTQFLSFTQDTSL